MKSFALKSILTFAAALLIATPNAKSAAIIIDDFNVNEGHFTSNPNASGSVRNIAASSTADRITTNAPVEGAGHQKIVLNPTDTINSMICRFLSGGGTIANNTLIPTTSGEDGWIGVYLKTDPSTTSTNWTIQPWLEATPNDAAHNNGGTPKYIIPDGQWHLYEWNLDETVLDAPNGWGNVSGIVNGSGALADGTHSFDSIIFRNVTNADNTVAASATFYMDFLAKSASGSVSNVLATPCIATTGVAVSGPLSTNNNQVLVSGVSATANELKVYQDTGTGMVPIGTNSTGLVAGDNFVTVSGMIKGAQVAATQKIGAQESCVPTSGIFAGGGANPRVKIAITIRETTDTGPVGATAANISSTSLHFLGASAVSSGAPIDATVINPSNQWQTITLQRGNETISDSSNAVGTVVNGSGYTANSSVAIQAYAYRTVPGTGIRIYSATAAESSAVTSNDVFSVNWTWAAVSGAEGYRLLRNLTGGFGESIDVPSNSLNDDGTAVWTLGEFTVTPTSSQKDRSVQWNPTVSNTNSLPGTWGILESINFCIADADTGPFDLYIDNVQNGSTVFQTFETVPAGTIDYGFRPPRNSGSTDAGLLVTPNVGVVTNNIADGGTNSFRARFQWNGTNATRWLRLTTTGNGTTVNAAANPLVNLDDPISFRLLLLPVGASLPSTPAITYSLSGNQLTLNWTGTFNLESKTNLNEASWTSVGVNTSPFVTSVTNAATFYRLHNP